jgi:hypothetical protein
MYRRVVSKSRHKGPKNRGFLHFPGPAATRKATIPQVCALSRIWQDPASLRVAQPAGQVGMSYRFNGSPCWAIDGMLAGELLAWLG